MLTRLVVVVLRPCQNRRVTPTTGQSHVLLTWLEGVIPRDIRPEGPPGLLTLSVIEYRIPIRIFDDISAYEHGS